jgi:hypothetical protein
LITKALEISWDMMWDSRNYIGRAPNSPCQHKAHLALNAVGETELQAGCGILPMNLLHHFETIISILLSKRVGLSLSKLGSD